MHSSRVMVGPKAEGVDGDRGLAWQEVRIGSLWMVVVGVLSVGEEDEASDWIAVAALVKHADAHLEAGFDVGAASSGKGIDGC